LSCGVCPIGICSAYEMSIGVTRLRRKICTFRLKRVVTTYLQIASESEGIPMTQIVEASVLMRSKYMACSPTARFYIDALLRGEQLALQPANTIKQVQTQEQAVS